MKAFLKNGLAYYWNLATKELITSCQKDADLDQTNQRSMQPAGLLWTPKIYIKHGSQQTYDNKPTVFSPQNAWIHH